MDHVNSMAHTSGLIQQPYPDVGPLTSPYEQQQPGKDLSQYATLKAVGEDSFQPPRVKRTLVSVLLRKRTQTF